MLCQNRRIIIGINSIEAKNLRESGTNEGLIRRLISIAVRSPGVVACQGTIYQVTRDRLCARDETHSRGRGSDKKEKI